MVSELVEDVVLDLLSGQAVEHHTVDRTVAVVKADVPIVVSTTRQEIDGAGDHTVTNDVLWSASTERCCHVLEVSSLEFHAWFSLLMWLRVSFAMSLVLACSRQKPHIQPLMRTLYNAARSPSRVRVHLPHLGTVMVSCS